LNVGTLTQYGSTQYRGEGWQIIVDPSWYALRAADYIFATLRSQPDLIRPRVAFGIGRIESVGSRDLSDARGPAFEAAGRGLDQTQRIEWLSMRGAEINGFHTIIVGQIAERAIKWTAPQVEALSLRLDPDNPILEVIAEALGISLQATSCRLQGAGASSLRRSLRAWEDEFELQRYKTDGTP